MRHYAFFSPPSDVCFYTCVNSCAPGPSVNSFLNIMLVCGLEKFYFDCCFYVVGQNVNDMPVVSK